MRPRTARVSQLALSDEAWTKPVHEKTDVTEVLQTPSKLPRKAEDETLPTAVAATRAAPVPAPFPEGYDDAL